MNPLAEAAPQDKLAAVPPAIRRAAGAFVPPHGGWLIVYFLHQGRLSLNAAPTQEASPRIYVLLLQSCSVTWYYVDRGRPGQVCLVGRTQNKQSVL